MNRVSVALFRAECSERGDDVTVAGTWGRVGHTDRARGCGSAGDIPRGQNTSTATRVAFPQSQINQDRSEKRGWR